MKRAVFYTGAAGIASLSLFMVFMLKKESDIRKHSDGRTQIEAHSVRAVSDKTGSSSTVVLRADEDKKNLRLTLQALLAEPDASFGLGIFRLDRFDPPDCRRPSHVPADGERRRGSDQGAGALGARARSLRLEAGVLFSCGRLIRSGCGCAHTDDVIPDARGAREPEARGCV